MSPDFLSDFLCLAPHPDDAELCCGGLLLLARRAGRAAVIVDCTRGEMGTRGSMALRQKEAAAADAILDTSKRVNLKLRDGHLQDGDRLRVALVRAIRRFRPAVLLVPHWDDLHPDHAAVGRAGEAAAWLCGVPKYDPPSARGIASTQALPYRPLRVLFYQNRYGLEADVVLDISCVIEQKIALVGCYASQFGSPKRGAERSKSQPLTRLSSERFLEWFRALHSWYGAKIGTTYGEAYCVRGPLGIQDVTALLDNFPCPQ